MKSHIISAFSLNKSVTASAAKIIVYTQVVLLLLLWAFSTSVFLPTPSEVWAASGKLWHAGVATELMTSFKLNIEAIFYATILSLIMAYATVMPFFRPTVAFVGKLRFLSLVGLSFVFVLLTKSSHMLKLSLLIFSITVFFVTSMEDVIASIPKSQYDHARSMGLKEWEIVWEVVILGQLDKVFDVIRQNAAISWLMLTMVEGIARSEGGIGTMLLNQNKHFNLAAVMAIQLMILLIGLGQDFLLAMLKGICCPYASLTVVKK